MSADAKDSHQAFAQKHALPYRLLMDQNKTLRSLWRVPKSMFILDGRVSYVIDKQQEFVVLFIILLHNLQHTFKSVCVPFKNCKEFD